MATTLAETQSEGAAVPVRLIKGDQCTEQTTQTAGMVRRELVATPGVWIGVARTPACSVSGWHHHGAYETYIYVQSGKARLESGPGGTLSCEAEAGDVLHVPRGSIHRETNTGATENVLLVIRLGTGEPAFNTDGPAS